MEFICSRKARKSSLPQCSCTRRVYRLDTHKERHFVLILFLSDLRMRHDENGLRAADRRRCRRQFGPWLVSCISRYNTRPLSFRSYFNSAASFAAKWLELMHYRKKSRSLSTENLTIARTWTLCWLSFNVLSFTNFVYRFPILLQSLKKTFLLKLEEVWI